MSLNIYFRKKDVPSNLELIEYNDDYFDLYTTLQDNQITRDILKEIDQAEFVSDLTFIGRDKRLGALYKEYLSTGTKTLLNIIAFPQKCFSVVECGYNALNMLKYINEGNILWEQPKLMTKHGEKCQFKCEGKEFTEVDDFVEYIKGVKWYE